MDAQPKTVVVIDNRDSFTHNIAHALLAAGAHVHIMDHGSAIGEIVASNPTHLIVSPGPGRPDNSGDTGVSKEAVEFFLGEIPILGICLGMQIICLMRGGKLESSTCIHHGTRSALSVVPNSVLHTARNETLEVMRYHSYEIVFEAHQEKSITAVARDDGAVMAVEWPDEKVFGVQYHPESVGSPGGREMLRKFLELMP